MAHRQRESHSEEDTPLAPVGVVKFDKPVRLISTKTPNLS